MLGGWLWLERNKRKPGSMFVHNIVNSFFYLAILYFNRRSIFATIHRTKKMLQVIIYAFDLRARRYDEN